MVLAYSTRPELGKIVPDFALPGTDGKTYSSQNFLDKNILVIIFTCNHCPYAKAARPRLIDLYQQFGSKEVQFIAINCNDDQDYPEDSFEHMREKKYNYPFPYLRDDSQETAKNFGAVCTPNIFVYDQRRKLAYHGRIDDNWREPKKATSHDLKNALASLLKGEKPSKDQKPSMGCSIKWK